MKTIGNDLIRHQLHENRKWYLALGILLVLFSLILLFTLPVATLSVVLLFGSLMMLAGLLHLFAAIKIFSCSARTRHLVCTTVLSCRLLCFCNTSTNSHRTDPPAGHRFDRCRIHPDDESLPLETLGRLGWVVIVRVFDHFGGYLDFSFA